jgi:hypothetical protein
MECDKEAVMKDIIDVRTGVNLALYTMDETNETKRERR